MSKNKIVIDLRRTPLTPEQTKDLHTAIHKTVVNQLKKSPPAPASAKSNAAGKAPGKAMKLAAVAASGPQTANLSITITGANPGKSNISAELNGVTKSVSKSGTLTFNNVNSGDIISLDGDSLGATTITIDISADPASMNFPQGHIDGNFFIN
jgi:hypothetical protein